MSDPEKKLAALAQKYDDLERSLAAPDTLADPVEYTRRMKEYRTLEPIIEKYRRRNAVRLALTDAQSLLRSEDAELRALAAEEFRLAGTELDRLDEELNALLTPRDPNDEKNVMVEIRAGTGGEEAALFASDLFRMYSMYAANTGYRVTVMNANETELGGYKEIVFMIEGDGAYSRFRFESGVHRVQRVPVTESQGRIQTSAATVAVLPEAEEISIEIRPADLVFETCKSSGAGGQHINKTESAVRLIHKPTGIVVECDQEHSQFKNRDTAMKMLRTRLFDMERSRRDDEVTESRRSQVGSGDRSARIRTYNFPQGRVTDHRIGLTLHTLEGFLNGDIGAMIDALMRADTADRLNHPDGEPD